jgi:ketosteroid isomerase-like protein
MVQMMILFCSIAIFADTPEAKTEIEVLAAMDAWKQAVVARDRAVLETLYAPGLSFTHSSGKQENKAEAIEAAINGKDRIESMDLTDVSVSSYGTTALVKARIAMRLNSGGTISTINLDALHVWIKISSRWQMVARHATRLNPN